jgi:hypothetical protein
MFRSIRVLLLAGVTLAATAAPALAAAPGNDDIATPEAIASIPYSNSQDASEATPDEGDPDCFGPSPTVWYSYTAADTGWLQADTFGSDYDTTLSVVATHDEGGFHFIDCNDDAVDLQSRVRFAAEAGVTYLFMIGSYGGSPAGALTFNLDATAPPVELVVSAEIDPVGRFLRDGSALIGVTVTCSAPAFAWLEIGVTQQVGRFTVRGWSATELECGTDPQHVLLAVAGDGGKFAGGMATVNLYGEAWDPVNESYAGFDASASVRLRK